VRYDFAHSEAYDNVRLLDVVGRALCVVCNAARVSAMHIKSRTRPHRLMTTVPYDRGRSSEAGTKSARPRHSADHRRVGRQAILASAVPGPADRRRAQRAELLDAETIAMIWLDARPSVFGVRANPGGDRVIWRQIGPLRRRANPARRRHWTCMRFDHRDRSSEVRLADG
jgi:hypothetical protein